MEVEMAKKARKNGKAGIKLADKAEKSSKMKDTKKYLSQIEPRIKSGHEYLKDSEERKKEIEFEDEFDAIEHARENAPDFPKYKVIDLDDDTVVDSDKMAQDEEDATMGMMFPDGEDE